MKPIEELANEYIAEAKRLNAIVEKLKKQLKAELKKKKDSDEIHKIRCAIISYQEMRDDVIKNAYEMSNYYVKDKKDRKDLKI